MTKQELIQKAARHMGCEPKFAARFLNAFLYAMTEALVSEETVRITGWGAFSVKAYAARGGRNPRTGERIRIPATRRVVFAPGKALKLS